MCPSIAVPMYVKCARYGLEIDREDLKQYSLAAPPLGM